MFENDELKDLFLDEEFSNRCDVFCKLLQQWGKVHNLSGRLTQEDIKENILDSIEPLKFIDDFESFADIGTGAGYPGLILAMAKSNKKCYLIEPRLKRVAFLNFVKNSLKLENVEVIAKRVEDVENVKVELISSRAVTNTKLLLDITKNISNSNSSFLFYKGSLLDEELEEAKINNQIIVKRKDRNYLYIKGEK